MSFLEYTGTPKSFTFSLYMGPSITLSKKDKKYFFKNSDIINTDSIKYYESLKPYIKLVVEHKEEHKDRTDKSVKLSVNDTTTNEHDKAELITDASLESNSVVSEVVLNIDKEDELVSDIITEEPKEVADDTIKDNISDSDISTYLDLNYDNDKIIELAKLLNVSTKRLRSKYSIIEKLVNEKKSELISLIYK